MGNSPNSPLSVFWLWPLRVLPAALATGSILAVAQVVGHLGLQRPLHQGLGELLEQPVLANQVFRLLVISQQGSIRSAGRAFFSTVIIAPCKYGSFLPNDRLHKTSYTLQINFFDLRQTQ